jgi:putative membrane protein insertion efficiency factor
MIARFLVLLIRGYQRTLSPLLGQICRFDPSCSQYTLVCIQRFGALRGVWLGGRRLARCHPFHPGGVDLPPEAHANCAHNTSLPARSLEQRP